MHKNNHTNHQQPDFSSIHLLLQQFRTYFLLIALVIFLPSAFFLYAQAPSVFRSSGSKSGNGQTAASVSDLYLDIRFDSNMMFAIYDLDLFLDETKIDTLYHGLYYTKIISGLENGNHTLTWKKTDDSSISVSASFNLKKDSTFSCRLHTNQKKIDLTEKSFSGSASEITAVLPNFTGTSLFEANNRLKELGFLNTKFSSVVDDVILDFTNWTVVEQNVLSDTPVEKSTPVILLCRKTADLEQDQVLISQATELIDAIGTVDLDSRECIEAARRQFDTLNPYVQQQIKNQDKLKAAESMYHGLLLSDIETRIAAIPDEITMEDADNIKTAYDEVHQIPTSKRFEVANITRLNLAYAAINDLESAERIKQVSQQIDSLSHKHLTLEDEEAVKEARLQFNQLSKTEQDAISNKDSLKQAEQAIEDLKDVDAAKERKRKEEEKKQALAKLKKHADEVKQITFYEASTEPKYINSRSYVLPYLGIKDDFVYMRLKYNLVSDRFLGWSDLTIAIDDERITKKFGYFDITRDIYGGDVAEYIDVSINSVEIEMLRKIAASQKTIICFESDDHYRDFTVPASDKKAIQEVLDAYQILKSK